MTDTSNAEHVKEVILEIIDANGAASADTIRKMTVTSGGRLKAVTILQALIAMQTEGVVEAAPNGWWQRKAVPFPNDLEAKTLTLFRKCKACDKDLDGPFSAWGFCDKDCVTKAAAKCQKCGGGLIDNKCIKCV